jgi:1-acyl-sn-glycerol-3-phosphate acyltransferase
LPTADQPSSPYRNSPPIGAAGVFRLLHRAPRVCFHVVSCLINLCFLALRRPTYQQRAACLSKWVRRALRSAGIHLQVAGPVPPSGVVVCNHTSYIDILVVSSAVPTLFVSKKEVRAYPIIGQAAELCGTIFIDRDKSVSGQNIASEMDEALLAGTCITFFPEGTTTDGSTMLRFRAALFSAPARLHLPIHPAAIRYTLPDPQHGDAAQLVCYWGDMELIRHALRLLTLPRVDANLLFGATSLVLSGSASPASENAARDEVRNAAHEARLLVQQLREQLGSPPLPAGEALTAFPPPPA